MPGGLSAALNVRFFRTSSAREAMEKPPIRKDYFESECGCRRWYESVPGGPVEELEEIVEYCEVHDIESGSA